MVAAQHREPVDRTCFRVTHNQHLLASLSLPIAGAVKLIEQLDPWGMCKSGFPCAQGQIKRDAQRAWRSRPCHPGKYLAQGPEVTNFEKQVLIQREDGIEFCEETSHREVHVGIEFEVF